MVDTIETENNQENRIYVKAIGDTWELDVLGVPYGSPTDRDADGEYFTPQTALREDMFQFPPVIFAHGRDENFQKTAKSELIGKTISYEDRPDGRWYRVALDRANQYAQKVWEAAKIGLAKASTGTVNYLARIERTGEIKEWPVAELTLIPETGRLRSKNRHAVAIPRLKAVYDQAGLSMPDLHDDEQEQEAATTGATAQRGSNGNGQSHEHSTNPIKGKIMSDENKGILDMKDVKDAIKAAIQAEREEREAEEKAKAEEANKLKVAAEEAVKAARLEWEEEAKKANRLPFNAGNAPVVGKFGDLRKFDALDAKDQAVMMGVMLSNGKKPSESAYKALVVKMGEDNSDTGRYGQATMKAMGIMDENNAMKANEVNYSTLASYGDEWVFDAQSQSLWESVRGMSMMASKLPAIQIPQGRESITIPLESTDPNFYLVSQVASHEATGGLSIPLPTVTSSRMGTSNQQLTVGKIGARTTYSGELEEDSLVPWASQLRMQIARAASETFDHVIIDGDTETSASTNINDIAGTPGGTEPFLLLNGFRKLALVTNTANSRSGGALDSTDFLETSYLMGVAGLNAADPTKFSYILDPHTYKKTLQNVTEIKTRDVWGASAPTIESGKLTSIWGSEILRSHFMHWAGKGAGAYALKANTAGKVDLDVVANNTTGSILTVRWDQWMLGWKRMMRLEVTRKPEYDGYEVVAMMRFGLVYRDTEAAAISYNVTV